MKITSFYYRTITLSHHQSHRIVCNKQERQENHQRRIFMQSVARLVHSSSRIVQAIPIYSSSNPFVIQDSRTSYPLLKTIPVLRNRKTNRVQSGGTLFPSKVIPQNMIHVSNDNEPSRAASFCLDNQVIGPGTPVGIAECREPLEPLLQQSISLDSFLSNGSQPQYRRQWYEK